MSVVINAVVHGDSSKRIRVSTKDKADEPDHYYAPGNAFTLQLEDGESCTIEQVPLEDEEEQDSQEG